MDVLWLRPSKGDNISVRRERIATELRERGYNIDIQDASGSDAFWAIKRALTGNYDIIAGNVRVGLYLGYPLSLVRGKPFLGDVSDPISDITDLPDILFRFFCWYEWEVLKHADATVFVYESTYTKARQKGIDTAVKLPNAVKYEAFADPDSEAVQEAENILNESGLDFERPLAIYIGVLESEYKITEILATAEHAPDWEFVFIGEGDLSERIRRSALEQENVHFPGAFEYRLMPGFLSHADVGFCFKNAEQPLKLKEYGAAGLPVIVRPGELSRFYDEDELVFVDPEPCAISDILAILQTDDELYTQYAEAGQAIAEGSSWEAIADGYDELFQTLAEQ